MTVSRPALALTSLLTAAALSAPATPAIAQGVSAAGGSDQVTNRIADQLDGTRRIEWYALTLDINGYGGKRNAQIVRIPDGHGKRWVGIIHVPKGKAGKASNALSESWFAQHHTQFVLPLKSDTNTDGGHGRKFHKAAKWAAKRLGAGWRVR